jgi:hypothetical protein
VFVAIAPYAAASAEGNTGEGVATLCDGHLRRD